MKTAAFILAAIAVLIWIGCLLGEFLALSGDADGSEMQRERENWEE